jgi:hypothetical protein
METKRKYTFKPNLWVLTAYKGQTLIGRTFIKNSIYSVMLITEDAKMLTIDFNELKRIKKLSIPSLMPVITTNIQLKKRKTTAEKQILETILSINKQ